MDIKDLNIKRTVSCGQKPMNLLNANPIKWSNTLKEFAGKLPTNCFSVFDHFVILAYKGLRQGLTGPFSIKIKNKIEVEKVYGRKNVTRHSQCRCY